MKSPWTKSKKDYVFNLFEYWIALLGFQPMHIQVEYMDEDKSGESETAFCAMDIDYLYPYRSVRLRAFPAILNYYERDNDTLERMMIHELMHMVLREMKEFRESPMDAYQKFEEKVCEKLAWFIHRRCTKRFTQ